VYKRIMLAMSVAIIALGVGLGTTSLVLAQQQAPKQTLLRKKSFGEWEYRVLQTQRSQANPEVTLSIESSLRGKANLTGLLSKQKSAKSRLFQTQSQLRAIVIPDQPLIPHELPSFVKKHGLTIISYSIIARAADGELITIFGTPEGETIFPERNLQTMVQGIERNTHSRLQIVGIVAIDAQLTREAFTSLEHDPAVLGLDLTAALALEDLMRETQIDPATIEVIPSSLYWANLEAH
jgi:hypothetical protein